MAWEPPYKGSIDHATAWTARPRAWRSIIYAYQDVEACWELFEALRILLKGMGGMTLLLASSVTQLPPRSLPPSMKLAQLAHRAVVVLRDSTHYLALSTTDGYLHLPTFPIPSSRPMSYAKGLSKQEHRQLPSHASSIRALVQNGWTKLLGKPPKGSGAWSPGRAIAGLKKGVRIMDTLVYQAVLPNLRAVFGDLLEASLLGSCAMSGETIRLLPFRSDQEERPSVSLLSVEDYTNIALVEHWLAVERFGAQREALLSLSFAAQDSNGKDIESPFPSPGLRPPEQLPLSLISSQRVDSLPAPRRRVHLLLHDGETGFAIHYVGRKAAESTAILALPFAVHTELSRPYADVALAGLDVMLGPLRAYSPLLSAAISNGEATLLVDEDENTVVGLRVDVSLLKFRSSFFVAFGNRRTTLTLMAQVPDWTLFPLSLTPPNSHPLLVRCAAAIFDSSLLPSPASSRHNDTPSSPASSRHNDALSSPASSRHNDTPSEPLRLAPTPPLRAVSKGDVVLHRTPIAEANHQLSSPTLDRPPPAPPPDTDRVRTLIGRTLIATVLNSTDDPTVLWNALHSQRVRGTLPVTPPPNPLDRIGTAFKSAQAWVSDALVTPSPSPLLLDPSYSRGKSFACKVLAFTSGSTLPFTTHPEPVQSPGVPGQLPRQAPDPKLGPPEPGLGGNQPFTDRERVAAASSGTAPRLPDRDTLMAAQACCPQLGPSYQYLIGGEAALESLSTERAVAAIALSRMCELRDGLLCRSASTIGSKHSSPARVAIPLSFQRDYPLPYALLRDRSVP